MRFSIIAALAFIGAVSCKDIIITVGGNTTNNATTVFQPNTVQAQLGDHVVFNFTQGNHSATQSTFASPCIPAHDTNITINGFDSGLRPAGNGTAITILTVILQDDNIGAPIWFYDVNTCGEGGVGAINNNESSTQTIAGFIRNAERLNGTAATSSSASPSATAPGASSKPTQTGKSSDTQVLRAGIAVLPLAMVAAGLSVF